MGCPASRVASTFTFQFCDDCVIAFVLFFVFYGAASLQIGRPLLCRPQESYAVRHNTPAFRVARRVRLLPNKATCSIEASWKKTRRRSVLVQPSREQGGLSPPCSRAE